MLKIQERQQEILEKFDFKTDYIELENDYLNLMLISLSQTSFVVEPTENGLSYYLKIRNDASTKFTFDVEIYEIEDIYYDNDLWREFKNDEELMSCITDDTFITIDEDLKIRIEEREEELEKERNKELFNDLKEYGYI